MGASRELGKPKAVDQGAPVPLEPGSRASEPRPTGCDDVAHESGSSAGTREPKRGTDADEARA